MKKACVCKVFFFIVLFHILLISKVTAQTIGKLARTDKNPVQTNYINTKDSTVRFETTNQHTVKNFTSSLTYYWYKSNAILKTVGAADGRILCGTYTCFYPDNNLKEKGQFTQGLKTGVWLTWFANGRMKELFTWKKGLLNGKHIVYDENGREILNENYKKGELQIHVGKKRRPLLSRKKSSRAKTPSEANKA